MTLGSRVDEDGWEIPVLSVSATKGTAIPELAAAIGRHRDFLFAHGRLAERRRRFQAEWIVKRLREDFGRFGITRLGGETELYRELTQRSGSPFDQYEALRARFLANWRD